MKPTSRGRHITTDSEQHQMASFNYRNRRSLSSALSNKKYLKELYSIKEIAIVNVFDPNMIEKLVNKIDLRLVLIVRLFPLRPKIQSM